MEGAGECRAKIINGIEIIEMKKKGEVTDLYILHEATMREFYSYSYTWHLVPYSESTVQRQRGIQYKAAAASSADATAAAAAAAATRAAALIQQRRLPQPRRDHDLLVVANKQHADRCRGRTDITVRSTGSKPAHLSPLSLVSSFPFALFNAKHFLPPQTIPHV